MTAKLMSDGTDRIVLKSGNAQVRSPGIASRLGVLTVIGGCLLLILILAAIIGPLLWPFDPNHQNLFARNLPPFSLDREGARHYLGTDPLGRDIAARLLLGTRISLMVGAVSALVAALIGVTFGAIAGYFGGLIDTIIMRIVDIQMSFPFLLIAIVWSLFLGTGMLSIVIVVALRGWVNYARIIRSRVLAVREHTYVEAARSLGSSTPRLLIKHVLPQTIPTIIILSALEVGVAIIFESTLGFLGLGIQPPTPTLGNMLAGGRDYLQTAWWIVVAPGIQLSLIVVAINLFGDGLRSLLDPKHD